MDCIEDLGVVGFGGMRCRLQGFEYPAKAIMEADVVPLSKDSLLIVVWHALGL